MEIPKKEGGIFFRQAAVIIIFIYYTIHTCRYIIIKHKTKDKTEENSLISCKKESTAAVWQPWCQVNCYRFHCQCCTVMILCVIVL